jgi:hypothetical protein
VGAEAGAGRQLACAAAPDRAWLRPLLAPHACAPPCPATPRVAADEARHLSWCLQRLSELGCGYGDMPAHDLLWEGCHLSAHDLGARLAVVPLGQEARGLDAGQRLAARLVGLGDNRSAAVVRRIAAEERAHVAVGGCWSRAGRWYRLLCSGFGGQGEHALLRACAPPSTCVPALKKPLPCLLWPPPPP